MQELDVRTLAPRSKQPTIHERQRELAAGETLRFINDHDPRPLRFEFDYPAAFQLDYLERGPEV